LPFGLFFSLDRNQSVARSALPQLPIVAIATIAPAPSIAFDTQYERLAAAHIDSSIDLLSSNPIHSSLALW
jgi:hypothetical protein